LFLFLLFFNPFTYGCFLFIYKLLQLVDVSKTNLTSGHDLNLVFQQFLWGQKEEVLLEDRRNWGRRREDAIGNINRLREGYGEEKRRKRKEREGVMDYKF
jgi:hypothetical protein